VSAFFHNVDSIFRAGATLRSETDVNKFVAMRREECVCSANLLLLLSDEFLRNQPFSTFYRNMAVTAGMTDSFVDAKQDQLNGEISLDPQKLRHRLIPEIITTSKEMIQAHPRKIRFMGYCLATTAEHIYHTHLRPRLLRAGPSCVS
jgi:Ni,Fe-hydrogenase III large subunit